MNPTELEALDSVYQELTPSDPVAAYAWLFDSRTELPNVAPVDLTQEPIDFSERDNQITEIRRAAVRAVYESGGSPAILGIAEAAEMPGQVGASFALSMDSRLVLDLAWEHLGSATPKLRGMAHGAFTALFHQSGWKMLEEVIGRIKAGDSTPQTLADVYLAAPARRETWQRLDSESQEVRTAYWKSLWWPNTGQWDSEDLGFVVRQLLSVHRSTAAVDWLALGPMSHEIVIQLLEALPADTAMAGDSEPHIDGFRIANLFEELDRSEDVPDEIIARLEIPYVGILEHDRPYLALHREVSKEPSLFADLVAWAFRRSDGQTDEAADDQTRRNRSVFGYDLLWRIRTLPGLMEDGAVDAEALSAWVSEARRLCKEHSREAIGDEQIGQILANAPIGEDGIWPCEPVRDLLDDLSSPNIGAGFTIGKRNLRGVTQRGVFDGGKQEQSLTDIHREDAARIAARWPFTANLLRNLSDSYESEGRVHDQQADWSDQFES